MTFALCELPTGVKALSRDNSLGCGKKKSSKRFGYANEFRGLPSTDSRAPKLHNLRSQSSITPPVADDIYCYRGTDVPSDVEKRR